MNLAGINSKNYKIDLIKIKKGPVKTLK
jgi:hypothetical protein